MTEQARIFAYEAHAAQIYGECQPYPVHLEDVVRILASEWCRCTPSCPSVILAAGYLHDVVEDTPTTIEDIQDSFGPEVASIVAFCTDETGPDRRTRKALTYARMRKTIDEHPYDNLPGWLQDAIRVKLADRLANLRACLTGSRPRLWEMYAKERETFGQALYVEGVCDAMWREYDRLLSNPPRYSAKDLRSEAQMRVFREVYGGTKNEVPE